MSIEVILFDGLRLTAKQYEDCLRSLPNPVEVLKRRNYSGNKFRVAVFGGINTLSALMEHDDMPLVSQLIDVEFEIEWRECNTPYWKPTQQIIIT